MSGDVKRYTFTVYKTGFKTCKGIKSEVSFKREQFYVFKSGLLEIKQKKEKKIK
jgi:hypothetical protein